MKKNKYIILATVLFSIFSFSYIVKASQEETAAAKAATEKYCEEDATTSGCVYDSNNALYTESGAVYNENFWVGLNVASTKLIKGYQAANADGKMIFAGCYKTTISGINYWDDGDYYIFKIVTPNGSNCSVAGSDIVPAKGTGYHAALGISGTYDGTIGIGGDLATYNWVATNGGSCPLMFGLTGNTRWYTSSSNRYVFADDKSGFDLMTYSFFGGEKYGTNPGCAVVDSDGHAQAKTCFDGAASKIENYTCPSDTTALAAMAESLESYQTSCDGEFKTLYSKGLLESDAKEFSDLLKEKAQNKIDSCYYSKCNISSSQQSSIDSNLSGTSCKDGCGTSPTTICTDCLKKAYTAAGLNSTQVTCLINSEAEKETAKDAVEKGIDGQFTDQVNQDLQDNQDTREDIANYKFDPNLNAPGFGENGDDCTTVLGANLTKVVHAVITIIRIAGAIIAVVNGMISLIPAIVSKDADALKKAGQKCVKMAIVLVLIGLLPSLLTIIGNIFGYDLSCIA